jgi:hypothetical protein
MLLQVSFPRLHLKGELMKFYRTGWIALLATAPLAFAVAQTSPSQDKTAPSAASSPHQRDATSTQTTEAPASNGAEPSAASSPHQHQAMKDDSKSSHAQMMKDCMAKEQAKDSSQTKDQVKKTCKDQMKSADSMSKQ